MKTGITTVMPFVVAIFLTASLLADDVEDVRAAVQRYLTAVNASDADTAIQHRSPEYNTFARGGGLLDRTSSYEQLRNSYRASIRNGVKRNYQIQHLDVKVYGDTAVVTGYLTGTRTQSDGTIIQMRDRRTGVWVKQGGQWREVHHHQSPVRFPQ